MSPVKISDQRRLLTLSIFSLILFFFIIYQFFKLQITEGDKWESFAAAQHHFSLVEPGKRGRFLVSNALKNDQIESSIPIAFDVKKFHLHIDPISIPNMLTEEISTSIMDILSIPKDKKEYIHTQFQKNTRSRRLKSWINEKEKKMILSWWRPFARWKKIPPNALYFEEDYQRAHPYGRLLGNVLHTVRDVKDQNTQQPIPTGGLELTLDSYLQGKSGKRVMLRSPGQSIEGGEVITYPQNGADVHLTIDMYIQAIAEEEIAIAVKKAKAKSGWAVMMNPNTGEIYALAQYPFFDPNHYASFYSDDEKASTAKVKSLTDCYEPGSTMKPISVAIALMANKKLSLEGKTAIFDPSEMMPVHDGTFPGRKTPIRDVGTHKYLNMDLAIQKSSNIYVAKLIQRVVSNISDKWYRKQLEEVFGFGQISGIELPCESLGLLPMPKKTYKSGKTQWSLATPYSLSFGYNLLVNSMQVVKAYAVLVNGGYKVQPTLIRKIVRDKETVFENSFSTKKVFDSDISITIKNALKGVTKKGGSGFKANISGYTMGGKTGTSEKIVNGVYSNKNHFSSFIGFTPAKNPKFLLYIGIDEPEYRYIPGLGKTYFGSRCAAPVFKNIMERTYKYLGTTPDDPYNYPSNHPMCNSDLTDWKKELDTLDQLYGEWNK